MDCRVKPGNDGRSRQVTPSSHEREPNCLKR